MPKFAERLQEAMKMRGIKQYELVKCSGIDKGAISRYLSGGYEPRKDRLAKLAEVLDVSESYLLGYTENPERLEDPDLQSFMEMFNQQTYKASHPVELSEEDYDIVAAFQKADEKTKKAVRVLLDIE